MLKRALSVLIICFSIFVSSEEIRSRQPKIFSFNAENEDVEVGLDFSIPFIKIPIKKTFNAITEFGIPGISLSKININPMALVLGGMIIVFLSVFTPFVNKAFAWHHFDRSSRLSDNDIDNFTTLYITEKLLENSRACPERVACWAGRRNKNTEVMRTWKHIMSNKLLSTMVNTTALKEATLRGLNDQNCDAYTPCPIEEKTLPKLLKNFAVLTNSK